MDSRERFTIEPGSGQERECPYSPLAIEIRNLHYCQRVQGYSSIDSTNRQARQLSEAGRISPGTLLVADMQTAGRGRGDHAWHSPAGTGIYASLLLPPVVEPARAGLVTLACAIAIFEALKPQLGPAAEHLDIKWPNDLLWKQRKICGILVESVVQDNSLRHLVAGFGINTGQRQFPDLLHQRAVSLVQITGRQHSRHDILLEVLRQFDHVLDRLARKEFQWICNTWENLSSFSRGRKVKFFEAGRPVLGVTSGLRSDGALKVLARTGEERMVYSGEIFEY